VEYKVIWSRFAEKRIDEIYDYYARKVNVRLAKKIVKNIIIAPNILIRNPKVGAEERLLQHRKIEYRYIVTTNYKIIYSVEEKDHSIRIADVFDTRQDPGKIEYRIP